MKYFLMIAVFVVGTIGFSTQAFAEVSMKVGLPGFYGSIDIGGHSQPQVIYREPKLIRYVSDNQSPIYMRVPPRHYRNWRKHCNHYNACNRRVLFVSNDWYIQEYAPHYSTRHEERERQDEYRDNDYHNNQGNRHDNGNNHNHGNGHNRRH